MPMDVVNPFEAVEVDKEQRPVIARACTIVKAVSSKGVSETMRELLMNTRRLFDYLKLTRNTVRHNAIG